MRQNWNIKTTSAEDMKTQGHMRWNSSVLEARRPLYKVQKGTPDIRDCRSNLCELLYKLVQACQIKWKYLWFLAISSCSVSIRNESSWPYLCGLPVYVLLGGGPTPRSVHQHPYPQSFAWKSKVSKVRDEALFSSSAGSDCISLSSKRLDRAGLDQI